MANSDTLPRLSFNGIEFPFENLSIRGGLRHALHEFPHTPGAEIEKQGRKAYTFTVKSPFHSLPGSLLDTTYPNLYPGRWRQLRDMFDDEVTGPFVVPELGTIMAVATTWNSDIESKIQSGQTMNLEFVEDQDRAKLVDLIAATGSQAALVAANEDLFAQAALADFKKASTRGFFQKINDAVTAYEGAIAAGDVASQVIIGKLGAIQNICAFADSQVSELQDPSNHLVITALKDLWLSARTLAADLTQSQATLRTFVTPTLMTIGQVSIAIYGTSERGMDVLQLNAIEDALAIRAGTPIRWVG